MTDSDHSLFMKIVSRKPTICIHLRPPLDELLVTISHEKAVNESKSDPSTRFDLMDKALVEGYIGLDVIRLGKFEIDAALVETGRPDTDGTRKPGTYQSPMMSTRSSFVLACMNVAQCRLLSTILRSWSQETAKLQSLTSSCTTRASDP
jgi:hypothetical protein